jgi:hypothetical protein
LFWDAQDQSTLPLKKQLMATFIKIFQPYPDERVAGVLCGTCGPCMYKVKAKMNVPLAFLECNTPYSCAAFNPTFSKVLVLSLNWASNKK